ncbi:MAG: glycosyltransferase family 2 protein, partial [Verrucomicrobiota bacterium]
QLDDTPLPTVSILVPARNEALNIGACVSSLLAQNYPNFSVHVLDDHSSDKTAQIVQELGLTESNGGLISGAPLPEGWVGKNWACHQLAQHATGELLLFTDADTIHAPDALRSLVAMGRKYGADLTSAWPEQITKSLVEKLVVSLLPFSGALFYPHLLFFALGKYPEWRKRVPEKLRRTLGAANGQVLLFTKAAYEAVGGHIGLRSHLVEDVALGRAVAAQMHKGLWLLNCDGYGLIRCRMYRNAAEVWEGFTKNVRAAFEGSQLGFLAAGCVQLILFLVPFTLLAGPASHHDWALGEASLVILMRALTTALLGGSWWSVVLHPVAYVLALCIGINSWRRSTGPGVLWKGRLYPVNHPLREPDTDA